jgi:hypothetical protein
MTIGGKPQVGFVHVAKQQKLLHHPLGRHAHNKCGVIGANSAIGRPSFVLPRQINAGETI